MKIRTDFVTNSSSSSFISLSIRDVDLLRANEGLELLQGDIYNEEDIESENDDLVSKLKNKYQVMHTERYPDHEIDDIYESFLEDLISKDRLIFDAYLSLLEEEGFTTIGLSSISLESTESGYGMASERFERDYGFLCSYVHVQDYYYDENADQQTTDRIMIMTVDEINSSALEDIASSRKNISYYLDPLALITDESSMKLVVRAYYEGLKEKGKSENEVTSLLGKYVKYF